MTAAIFTKKTRWQEVAHMVHQPLFAKIKSTDLKSKTHIWSNIAPYSSYGLLVVRPGGRRYFWKNYQNRIHQSRGRKKQSRRLPWARGVFSSLFTDRSLCWFPTLARTSGCGGRNVEVIIVKSAPGLAAEKGTTQNREKTASGRAEVSRCLFLFPSLSFVLHDEVAATRGR